MKMTKCDRCGKISTVNPTTKNLEFPIIHITKADDIFQSVTPREIDLCQMCRKELDGWLTKKPVDVMREKMRESMKATTEISRIIDETVKKMAEPTIGGKTIQEFMQTQGAMTKAEVKEHGDNGIVDVLDDLISAYHKGLEDLYRMREEAVRRATAADGETE